MPKKNPRIFHINRKPAARGGALVVAMPGIPQSIVVDEPDDDGVIFKYLVPDAGTICGLHIFVEELNVKETAFKFAFTFGRDEGATGFIIKKGLNAEQADQEMEVIAGDRLTLSIHDSPEVKIRGIWVSFIFRPRAESKYITKVGEKK